ncbi:BQ2448_218 [Microbotryum intermedium]|uniref:Ribosome biogenesis protein NOP53 n=1 Tax=Microbotryum intermedium TaxID=269621 RepID=A0A238F4X7_9BASI|nr:BQ2448_218 [Microbotryum intermedium]
MSTVAPPMTTRRSGRANSKKAAPSSAESARAATETAASTVAASRGAGPGAEDDALFQIDTVGSSSVRHALLRDHVQAPAAAKMRKGTSFKKPLKSEQILAARSAVPAISSRVVPAHASAVVKKEQRKAAKVNRETKERLKRIVGRVGQGQGLRALKSTDKRPAASHNGLIIDGGNEYDAWGSVVSVEQDVKDVDKSMQHLMQAHFGQIRPKPPTSLRSHALLGVADSHGPRSVPTPHPGTSYNPAHDQHQALLSSALETYTTLEKREDRGQPVKEAMDRVRISNQQKDLWEMYEDEVGSGEDEGEDDAEGHGVAKTCELGGASSKKNPPKRKTRQQRNRKLLVRDAQQELAERRASKARIASVLNAPSVNAAIEASRQLSLAEKAAAMKVRKARLSEGGLTRFRSGPSRVPNAPVTFQLGDELADNLRSVAPEGNLWKEWVSSGMRRGKVPVERANESKKGGRRGGRGHDKDHRTKIVEKYAFKNWIA